MPIDEVKASEFVVEKKFFDKRDKTSYNTVVFDKYQVMTENLCFEGHVYYYCDFIKSDYKNIVPNGFKIPTISEWQDMILCFEKNGYTRRDLFKKLELTKDKMYATITESNKTNGCSANELFVFITNDAKYPFYCHDRTDEVRCFRIIE